MRIASLQNVVLFALISGGMYLAWKNGYLRFGFLQPVAPKNTNSGYVPMIPNSPEPAKQAPPDEPVNVMKLSGSALRAALLPFMAAAEGVNRLPAGILDKMAQTESAYRADIVTGKTVSAAGAVGLMQIIPRWHPNAKPLDPIASVNYAASYLRELYNQFGDWTKAVAAYNWGRGNLAEKGMARAPAETKNYVKKVLGVTV